MVAPVIKVRASADLIEKVGGFPSVDRVMVAYDLDDGGGGSTEDYYFAHEVDELDILGYDGTGRTVAMLEGSYPDSWNNLDGVPPGIPNHSCDADSGGGGTRRCHCPGGSTDAHVRLTMGVVRSTSTSHGGIADRATTLPANWSGVTSSGVCTATGQSYGSDRLSSAIGWATSSGARVVNYSWAAGATGDPQTSKDMYFDYVAQAPPWPLVVAITYNGGLALQPSNNLRNGLVVGGSDDKNTAAVSDDTMYTGTQAKNHSSGWELPHITATAVSVRTAGFAAFTSEAPSGTSAAAPIVSGIAADLQEANGLLAYWPEALIVGLLVGAAENVDEAQGGVWPLNLGDSVDDSDGVGLVNADNSYDALRSTSKAEGGDPAELFGHDYGVIYSSTSPPGWFYAETYNAKADPGEHLVAASIMLSYPTCSPPGENTCTSNAYPIFLLAIYDGATLVGYGLNIAQNYQYATVNNDSQSTKNYQIKLFLYDWMGLVATTFAVAWNTIPT